MSDPANVTSLFVAAERAAMSGDFAAAARCLADAARAQEAALGPDHPDLANTLNNLAVAHERSGQLDAAERDYRRAYAIAARRLPPGHPQLVTSAENLREFCEANGRPLDPILPDSSPGIPNVSGPKSTDPSGLPSGLQSGLQSGRKSGVESGVPSGVESGAESGRKSGVGSGAESGVGRRKTADAEPLAITFAADAPAAPPAPARGPGPASRIPPMPPAEPRLVAAPDPAIPRAASRAAAPAGPAAPIAARRSWLPVLLALGAIGVLLIWMLAGRGPAQPASTPQSATPEGSPPLTPPAAAPGAPAATPPPATPPAATRTPAPAAQRTQPPAKPAASAPASGASAAPPATGVDGVSVGDASLCARLAPGYRCEPARSPVRAGSLTFYTRVLATRPTSVVHRWYRGSELRQSVRLQIPPRRGGFRTYSRATVSPSQGEWRVELRSRDGRLLHTETFTVR